MNVHSVSLKGRRDNNEDKHTIIINTDKRNSALLPINLFGVYDGHGGKFVSKFLSENLPNYFLSSKKFPFDKQFIYETFENLQKKLKISHKIEAAECGSTCLVLVHYSLSDNNYINVFNVGDSRSVLCRDNLAIPLTLDHKPNWPMEKRRIEKLGGNIYFDGYDFRIKDLSVSRAFGDIKAEPFLTAKPDIFKYRLEKNDKFIVMGCDGLYDFLSNQDIVNYVLNECYDENLVNRINKDINIAKKLGEHAIEKGSRDNITVIVIFFN